MSAVVTKVLDAYDSWERHTGGVCSIESATCPQGRCARQTALRPEQTRTFYRIGQGFAAPGSWLRYQRCRMRLRNSFMTAIAWRWRDSVIWCLLRRAMK